MQLNRSGLMLLVSAITQVIRVEELDFQQKQQLKILIKNGWLIPLIDIKTTEIDPYSLSTKGNEVIKAVINSLNKII